MVQKKTIKKANKKSTKKAANHNTVNHKSNNKSTNHDHQKSKTSSNKLKDDDNNGKFILYSIITAIILILLILAFKGLSKDKPNDGSAIVAKIDSLEITSEELDVAYAKLPDEFQTMITKEQYLEELYIPQKIILEKAKVIPDQRIKEEYNKFLELSGQTKEEIMATLEENGVTEKDFMDSFRIQLFLNDTLYESIKVTEEDILNFYETNKESITDENGEIMQLDDVRADIDAFLRSQKLQEETVVYMEEVKSQMNIETFSENINSENNEEDSNDETQTATTQLSDTSFDLTSDEICTENGKPIIRMFSTTWCPHCKWIKPVFEKVIAPYVESGQIIAYHWELDINDNTLTPDEETSIPEEEMAIYKKYNPKGSIPTFVFGCKYSRIGNGFEGKSNGEASEEADMTNIIEDLIASSN